MIGALKKVPLILQHDTTECGLACIAMIATHHGKTTTLHDLRDKVPTSRRGISLINLRKLSSLTGLGGRVLKVGMNSLHKLSLPCVLHWDHTHYVVLTRVTRTHIYINDPARGRVKLSMAQASPHVTGVALELSPGLDFSTTAQGKRVSMFDLVSNTRDQRLAMTQIFFLALLLEFFVLAGPLNIQLIMDNVLVSQDRSLLNLILIGFLCLIMFKTILSAARTWAIALTGARTNAQTTDGIFRHLLQLPLHWFERRFVGDVVSRFGSIKRIQDTLSVQFVGVLLDGLMSITTLVILSLLNLKILLVTLLAFAIYSLSRIALLPRLMKYSREYQTSYAKQYGDLVESVRGSLTIKLNNNECAREARFQHLVHEACSKELTSNCAHSYFAIYKDLIFGASRLIIVWLCARSVLDNSMTVGLMLSVIAYTELLINRGGALLDSLIDFRLLQVDLDRLSDIICAIPESAKTNHMDCRTLEPSLSISHLSYRYSDDDPWILKDLSLDVQPGESIAISGASGCGKTTLAKLILGLISQTEGQIYYGANALSHLGRDNFRNIVGAVMQGDQLFGGTIAQNVCFFSDDCDMEQVIQACKLADIHEHIMEMPSGYHSVVGDMGSSLSGGQKQRLILARALYRNPQLIILDEATSHLDMDSERRVSSAIQRLQITRIIIAHRAETIATASRHLVLKDGQLIDPYVALRPQEESIIADQAPHCEA